MRGEMDGDYGASLPSFSTAVHLFPQSLISRLLFSTIYCRSLVRDPCLCSGTKCSGVRVARADPTATLYGFALHAGVQKHCIYS